MNFKTSFTKDASEGTKFTTIIKDYNLIQKPSGELDLVECGEHDIQEEIDSYKDDCDINLLIAKFLNGDTTTGIGTPFKGTDLTDIDIDINTAFQKMNELKSNPLFDEFLRSDTKITNKNLAEKFTEFLNKKNKKPETTEKETKKEEVKSE
ncbi:putative VP3 [Microvirus sp.]|nr:putative VP3 [Microvirus sp.]